MAGLILRSQLLVLLKSRADFQSSVAPEVGRRPWMFRELPSGLDFAKLVSTRGLHVKARTFAFLCFVPCAVAAAPPSLCAVSARRPPPPLRVL